MIKYTSVVNNSKENRFYKIPETESSAGYLQASGFTVLNDQMYFFGGYDDRKKVRRLFDITHLKLEYFHSFVY